MITELALMATVSLAPAIDLLPDITIWPEKLHDNAIDTNQIPGRTLLRLSTGTPNIGTGRLELRGGQVVNGEQQVNQRIYRDDNTFWERPAGFFTFHSNHGHIHFDDWCIYRLREILPGGEVGDVIATGSKTSFCILDLVVFNSSQQGFRNPGWYNSCGTQVQGLTPGWADIYDKSLTDQWIDITGVPNGTYYLEAEVDPDNAILEVSESNNIGRVEVIIGNPPPTEADLYEENDSRAQVDARPEAAVNSPNLGLVNARRDIDNLSMQAADPDWFKFRINRPGGVGDFVGISSTFGQGDLDMRLYNSQGTLLASSTSGSNFEQITLNGRPAGTYYVQVFPFSGENPRYKFMIQPSGNLPPNLTINSPLQDIFVERSIETIPVAWLATDPENDPMKISIFRDLDTVDDKGTLAIGGYQNLPAGDSAANVNTAEMPVGTFYLHFKVTDGGAVTRKVAPGRYTLYVRGDVLMNGVLDFADYNALANAGGVGVPGRQTYPPAWKIIADMDKDGDLDAVDLRIIRNTLTGR